MSELLRAAESATHPASGSLPVAPAGPALAAPPAQPGDSDYDSDELLSSSPSRLPASPRTALLRGTERASAAAGGAATGGAGGGAGGGASAELKRRSTLVAKIFHRRSSSGGGMGAAELQPRAEPSGDEGGPSGGTAAAAAAAAAAGAESSGGDGQQRTWRMMLKDLERIAMAPWDAASMGSMASAAASSKASPRHGRDARQREARGEAPVSASPVVVRGVSVDAAAAAEPLQVRAKLVRTQPGQSFGITVVDTPGSFGFGLTGTATVLAVSSVEPGGIAEAAGLQVGDCIGTVEAPRLGVIAVKVKNREHMRELLNYLQPGVECTITVSRMEAFGVALNEAQSVRRSLNAATQGDAVAALVNVTGLSAEMARAFVAPRWREGATSVEEIVNAYCDIEAASSCSGGGGGGGGGRRGHPVTADPVDPELGRYLELPPTPDSCADTHRRDQVVPTPSLPRATTLALRVVTASREPSLKACPAPSAPRPLPAHHLPRTHALRPRAGGRGVLPAGDTALASTGGGLRARHETPTVDLLRAAAHGRPDGRNLLREARKRGEFKEPARHCRDVGDSIH